MKKIYLIVISLFLVANVFADKVYITKISTKTEQDLKSRVNTILESNDFEITENKEDADLHISIFSDVKTKRNINWGGWLIAYPLFGAFHDVGYAETTLKVTDKTGNVIYKENTKNSSKEGYLFSDFKGGFNKISKKAESLSIEKAFRKFFTDYRI